MNQPARPWRARGILIAGVLAAVALVPANASAAAPKPSTESRYSLVHGCFALAAGDSFVAKSGGGYAASASGAGAAEPFRMQATDLGTYLLYGKAGDFLAAGSGDSVIVAKAPSPAAEWVVEEAGDGFTLENLGTGNSLAPAPGAAVKQGEPVSLSFTAAEGCATYPEVDVSASGKPVDGPTPYGETRGFWDPHMHMMAFEAFGGGLHCGRPWSRYGVPSALPDCAATEGPGGSADPVANFLNWSSPVDQHDTVGWPTFKDWPNHHSLTYEQTYYKWLERSWMGGMRLAVNLFVDNRAFCQVLAQPQHRRNECDEMATVRKEATAIYAMQDYIDAQAGGPGEGFFRIVRNPFEARRVINDGKMAVVLGIEVSELFGCTLSSGVPQCDQKDVDAGLDEFYDLGVRDLELLNKFDNAFVGVRFDSGTFGAAVNTGNFLTTGRFWQTKRCTGPEEDNQIDLPPPLGDPLYDLGLDSLLPPGGLPVYPSPPHCNVLGMTPLGEYLVRAMIDRGMVIDPDHMSVDAANRALEIANETGYSGLVSSHSWTDERNWPDIYDSGGVVAPKAGGSESFIETWKVAREMRDPDYYFGFGFGDDMNGFASQGAPREGASNPVSYPFKSFDGGVTFERQRSGKRTFDINTDGVAHYGLYPDWVEDLRMQAGDKIVKDLSRGSEAYLQMWERAVGVAPEKCLRKNAKLSGRGLGKVRLGDSAKRALKSAGQPDRRVGRLYRYCVAGKRGGEAVAVFTKRGKVGLVVSAAPGHRAGAVAVGDRTSKLARAKRLAGNVAKSGRFVYRTRGGKVAAVAVASGGASKRQILSGLKLAR